MKKITFCLIATCLLLTFRPVQSNAAPSTLIIAKSIKSADSAEAVKSKALLLRLKEIKAMDKSNLTSSEKKDLRMEVRTIKYQYREMRGGGLYISGGGVIIIIILLLILFH